MPYRRLAVPLAVPIVSGAEPRPLESPERRNRT